MQPTIVKPELLQWAIDRGGVPAADLATNRNLRNLPQWLEGESVPSFNQLELLSRQTRTPFGYFFLDTPPKEPLPVKDFRTKDGEHPARPSPELLSTIYSMQRRQGWMQDRLIEAGHDPLPWVGSIDYRTSGVEEASSAMRRVLNLEPSWARSLDSQTDALRFLRLQIEAAGVLVFFNGVLGNNNKAPLSADEFRGFVLIDPYAPLIFVNNSDAKAAQIFTLAHELAHVLAGVEGIVDTLPFGKRHKLETFCNRVAAEFLAPGDLLKLEWRGGGDVDDEILRLSRSFRVSRIVIARRLQDLGLLARSGFIEYYRRLIHEYTKLSTEAKQKASEKPGGPPFLQMARFKLGDRFSHEVITAVRSGDIGYKDARSLTGLSSKNLGNLAKEMGV